MGNLVPNFPSKLTLKSSTRDHDSMLKSSRESSRFSDWNSSKFQLEPFGAKFPVKTDAKIVDAGPRQYAKVLARVVTLLGLEQFQFRSSRIELGLEPFQSESF